MNRRFIMTDKTENIYEDIIHLPHYVSQTRPKMPMTDRAAQFAGFAALSGFGDMINSVTLEEEQYYFDDDCY